LQTQEARQKLLIEETDVFMSEMEHVHSLSVRSPFYRRIKRNFVHIKQFCYALVVLLNLNVLMSPQSLKKPFILIVSGDYADLSPSRTVSLGITIVLGIFNFFGVSKTEKACSLSIMVIFASTALLLDSAIDAHCLSSWYADLRHSQL